MTSILRKQSRRFDYSLTVPFYCPEGASVPGVVELKAEQQRSQQQSSGDSNSKFKSTDSDTKQAATGWFHTHKAQAALGVAVALLACVQAFGILDVRAAAAQLFAPVLRPLWKVC